MSQTYKQMMPIMSFCQLCINCEKKMDCLFSAVVRLIFQLRTGPLGPHCSEEHNFPTLQKNLTRN